MITIPTGGEGWRTADKGNPFPHGEWLKVVAQNRPLWSTARFAEDAEWLDENGDKVRGVGWWRHFHDDESTPAK